MKSAKAFLTAALALVGAMAFAGGNGQKNADADKARQLLQKTLERTYPQNVVALILQRSPDNASVLQRIQVQISRDGKMRQTVMYPLSMEGVETIDDGTRTTTFLPDRNLVLVQESPHLLPDDAKSRMEMTMRNYDLKLAGTSTVAGKTATIVVATPRNRDMDTRRYYIDGKTGFLLELETVNASGHPKLGFRAQAVDYPDSISPTVFEVCKSLKECDRVTFKRPKSIMRASKEGFNLGFDPVLPRNLPYGFSIQDVQVNDTARWRSVAVRISDGLVKGTVYQWQESSAGVEASTMPGTSADVSDGIRIVVAADVPEAARKKILQIFTEAARRTGAESLSPNYLEHFLELSLRQISFSLSELPKISITVDKLAY